MWVVDLAVLLVWFDLPFWVDLGILDPCALFPLFCTTLVGFVLVTVEVGVVEFAFFREDGVWEAGVEGAVLDNVLEHRGEVKAFRGKFALLTGLEEILHSEVEDVEDLGGKESVLTIEVDIGGNVGLDVCLEFPQLGDEETVHAEDDS